MPKLESSCGEGTVGKLTDSRKDNEHHRHHHCHLVFPLSSHLGGQIKARGRFEVNRKRYKQRDKYEQSTLRLTPAPLANLCVEVVALVETPKLCFIYLTLCPGSVFSIGF
jgi:hypothetical protein